MINANGTVLVSDFGIARMSESATATMVGAGTPAYMAPEQARGEDPTPQTDIYALGVVLFEMLTGGERPFTGESAQTTGSTSEKIRWEQMKLEPPSPRKYNPAISPQLEEIILRCLNKNPAARYSSTLELLVALDTAISASQIKAIPSVVKNVSSSKISPAYQPQVSQETNQGQPVSSPKKSARTVWIIGSSILLICITLCAVTTSISNSEQQAQANATSTAQAEVTNEAIVQATNAAEATMTAQAGAWQIETEQADATSTAQVEATSTASAWLGPYSSWNLLFHDPFIDNSNDWSTGTVTDEYWSVDQGIGNGYYTWTITKSNGVEDNELLTKIGKLTDFYISVEGQEISGSNSSCYGLAFRDDNNHDFYLFEVCNGKYRVSSHSANSGWKTLLGPKTTSAIASGQTNKLAVAAQGSHFKFYINDQLIDTLNDDQYANGYVGLGVDVVAGNTPTFQFGNFVISTP